MIERPDPELMPQDPVPNVRLRWLELAPAMRGCLTEGKDDATIQTLATVVGDTPEEVQPSSSCAARS